MKCIYNFIKILFIVVVSIISIFPVVPHVVFAAGNTYYVAKTGSDKNDGSLSHPWLTIQHAANAVVAGDTVYVRGGVYSEKVYIGSSGDAYTGKSGTSSSPITYTAYPGESPIIDGTSLGSISWGGLITVYNVSYITISGFEIRNCANQKGVCVFGSCRNLTLSSLEIHDCQLSGIYIETTSNLLIDNCVIYNTNRITESDEQLSLLTCNNFEIRNCTLHNSGKNALDIKNGSSNGSIHNNEIYGTNDTTTGIYLDCNGGAQDNIDIYNNRIHDCIGPGIVLGSEVSPYPAMTNIDIYNNLIYNNNTGFAVWANSFTRNFRIINNTFYKNDAEIAIYGSGSKAGVNSDCIIRNNIIVASGEYIIYYEAYSTAGTITIDHNLYYDTSGNYNFQPANLLGSSYVRSNPLLTNPVTDFSIPTNSPAKDAGSSANAPGTDYTGTARPKDSGYDIGAFEYNGGGSTPVTTYTLTVSASTGGTTIPIEGTSETYNSGQTVEIIAIANTGYHFVNWTGDVTKIDSVNSATTTISMNGNYTIQANFAINTYNVIYLAGANGSVSGVSSQTVNYGGSSTSVSAVPNNGYYFVNWNDGSTQNPRVDSNVVNNITVTANFSKSAYTVTTSVSGSGSITKNPEQPTYSYGTSVQLTAIPAPGWNFAGWSGSLAGTTNPKSITINVNKSVTATFTQNSYNLMINVTGSGSVTRNDVGPYQLNDVVQLTAIPESGWTFIGWSGDITGNSNPQSITIEGNKSVTATFSQILYSLKVNISGSGNVIINPGQSTYEPGMVVQLTAEPGSGSSFSQWLGDITGSLNPQTITINSNKTVTAVFINNSSVIETGISGENHVVAGGNGGSYSVPGITDITMFTNNEGKFNLPATVESENNQVRLNIGKGVVAKNKNGYDLRWVSIMKATDDVTTSKGTLFISPNYELGPEGTTFDPQITLAIAYDPSLLPNGLSEQNIAVGYWDPTVNNWVVLNSTVDTVTHTITTKIGHFSRYALIVKSEPASFTFSNLVTPGISQVNEPVTILVTVKNTGDLSGSSNVTLDIKPENGYGILTKTVQLNGGASQEVPFDITEQLPGTYTVNIGDITGSFVVAPALSVQNTNEFQPGITIDSITPSLDNKNQIVSAAIDYRLSNPGENIITRKLLLNVEFNGEPLEKVDIFTGEISPHKIENNNFQYVPSSGWEKGNYVFNIDMITDGNIVARTPPNSLSVVVNQPQEVSWYILLIIIGVLIVTSVITVVLILRRRNQLIDYWKSS